MGDIVPARSRLEGWESRLAQVIEAARTRSYVLGEWDCFRFATSCIEALTGVNRWQEFAGTYRTRREALIAIAKHGRSFEAAADVFFGSPSVDVRQARRGDIVAIQTADGEKHLGVVTLDGAKAAFMHADGLIFVPVLTCKCAWRIG